MNAKGRRKLRRHYQKSFGDDGLLALNIETRGRLVVLRYFQDGEVTEASKRDCHALLSCKGFVRVQRTVAAYVKLGPKSPFYTRGPLAAREILVYEKVKP